MYVYKTFDHNIPCNHQRSNMSKGADFALVLFQVSCSIGTKSYDCNSFENCGDKLYRTGVKKRNCKCQA